MALIFSGIRKQRGSFKNPKKWEVSINHNRPIQVALSAGLGFNSNGIRSRKAEYGMKSALLKASGEKISLVAQTVGNTKEESKFAAREGGNSVEISKSGRVACARLVKIEIYRVLDDCLPGGRKLPDLEISTELP